MKLRTDITVYDMIRNVSSTVHHRPFNVQSLLCANKSASNHGDGLIRSHVIAEDGRDAVTATAYCDTDDQMYVIRCGRNTSNKDVSITTRVNELLHVKYFTLPPQISTGSYLVDFILMANIFAE